MPLLEIFGNILVPSLSGIILFIFFLYFVFIEEAKSVSTRYFTIFLISFCLFLLSRPLQISLGPHPVPLIINNIRSFVFSAVTIPMIILADFSRPEKSKIIKSSPLILWGVILGIIYCVFNTLTTSGSQVIFELGNFQVYDSKTPLLTPPFYGREVTIGVYLILATILFIDSIQKIKRAGMNRGKEGVNQNKVYLYSAGKLIFALTFFFGSLLQQWWTYYMGSLVSVAFLGSGVVLDIRENKKRMQKVITYIREDLISDLSIDAHLHQQVSDMLELLHIPRDINTFIALRESERQTRKPELKDTHETLTKEITSILDQIKGTNQSILMPIGSDMLGICLSISGETDSGRSETIKICEHLKNSLEILNNYNFGIGRNYSGLEDLKLSYHEAVNAVEYAGSMAGGQVIHISDFQEGEKRREYPLKEKNSFLAAIRMGDRTKALDQLQRLLTLLFRFSNETDELLKVRIYELLGTMVESAMAGGGDVDDLLELSEKLFNESAIIRSRTQLIEWLKNRTGEMIDIVSRSHSNRYKNIVRKAKEYIDKHYAEAISVKDVADAVCISESYFKSVFKKSSGYSYSEYLTSVRIDQARKLLNTTEKSVMEIALDVGFQTPNSFSSLFKRETGLTPTQFKNSSDKS